MECSSIFKVRVAIIWVAKVATHSHRWVLLASHNHQPYPLCHNNNHSTIQRQALAQITMLRHHSITIFRHIQHWIRKKRIWTHNFYRSVEMHYTRTKCFCLYFTFPLSQNYVCMIRTDFKWFRSFSFFECVFYFPFGLECFVNGMIF